MIEVFTIIKLRTNYRVAEKNHSMVFLGNKIADESKEWKLIHWGKI